MEVIPVSLIAENSMLETKSNRNKIKEKIQIIYQTYIPDNTAKMKIDHKIYIFQLVHQKIEFC